MNIRACGIGLFAAISLSAGPVEAVTYSYDAVVTAAFGPHSNLFHPGARLAITYMLDPSVNDTVSDPQRGIFRNAVLSMAISFPDSGIFAFSGPAGTAQTFDNILDEPSGHWSDQIFFFGGPISSASSLNGEPISFLEVDFGTGFLTPPAEPLMLSSDALPLFKLPIIDEESVLFLGTSSGYTQVDFAANHISQGCTPNATTLCLSGGRFRVEAEWHKEDGESGLGQGGPLTSDTGFFWFFNPANVEIFVKVLNACSLGHYWVFAGGLTNVQVVFKVTDTQTGETRSYSNPQGRPFQPIQDTSAFAVCP